jgi:GNAT superfamily N-acetyltransferase
MNPITIRNLGPEDVHILERVREGTFDNPIDPSRAYGFLATRVNEIVVALDQGEVIGFASGTVIMHPDQPFSFFINEVGVHEAYQRHGIASRLMKRIVDLARDRDDNHAARELYRSLGAHETESVVLYEWDGERL